MFSPTISLGNLQLKQRGILVRIVDKNLQFTVTSSICFLKGEGKDADVYVSDLTSFAHFFFGREQNKAHVYLE